jgi:hypothetical protein
VALLELVEQPEHTSPALRGVIESDVELRDPLEPEARPELATYERHRPVQGGDGLVTLGPLADHADPDPRVAEIRIGLDVRDRHEADPRVGHLAGEDLPDLLPKKLVDAIRALSHWQSRTEVSPMPGVQAKASPSTKASVLNVRERGAEVTTPGWAFGAATPVSR